MTTALAKSSNSQSAYFYVAAGVTGNRKLGFRRASSPRHLAEQLRREQLVPLKNWSVPGLGGDEPARKLKLKDQSELNFQLSQLLSRGVPLVEALEVAASAVSPAVRPIVERLRESVAAGTSFADACRATNVFDPVTIGIYRASERTGDLAGAAAQLAITFKRQLAISGKAITLLIYPVLVLSISVIVSVLMLTVVVPSIGKSLKASGVEIPTYSAIVFSTGEFMRDNILWCGLAVLVLSTIAVFVRKFIFAAFNRFVRKLPFIKDVLLAQESARFFNVMSSMTHSGVPLSDGLVLATQAVSDPKLSRELVRLRTRLVEGGVLRQLIEDVHTLPLATRRLMIAGERSGDLQTVFNNLAADHADEVDRRSTRLLSAMEPLLIVMMFLMIGSLLLSIMIPLMSLANQVG